MPLPIILFYHKGVQEKEYIKLIEIALKEDLGELGDITSDAIFSDQGSNAILLSKDNGILAGSPVFISVFKRIDRKTEVDFLCKEGDMLKPGIRVAKIQGKARSILTAERTAINFLSFLSGIATRTREFVLKAHEAGKAVILDTRKTLPAYRSLSKYAVKIGGGRNHRMGLYDMVLIKDNHIDTAGSITRAVEQVRKKWKSKYKIEVECRTLGEVEESLHNEVDVIMLDNMPEDLLAKSVKLVNGQIKIEASGGVSMDKIADLSASGVDYISVGMLTHSVKAFDFSLKILL